MVQIQNLKEKEFIFLISDAGEGENERRISKMFQIPSEITCTLDRNYHRTSGPGYKSKFEWVKYA